MDGINLRFFDINNIDNVDIRPNTIKELIKQDTYENVTHHIIYYYDEDNNKWIQIEDGYTASQDESNSQKVNINITNANTINKRIRAIIHTECKQEEFCENEKLPKDSNDGEASVTTKFDNIKRITKNYTSPKLIKIANKASEEPIEPLEDDTNTQDFEEVIQPQDEIVQLDNTENKNENIQSEKIDGKKIPKTGDNIYLVILVMLVCIILFRAITLYIKKKKNK